MAEYRGLKAILRQFYVLIKQKLDSIKVDADHFEGTLPVAKGGTGASDGQTAFDNIASGVRSSSAPADSETMLLHSKSWYKTTVADFWNYIKGKIAGGWSWNPGANITMTPTANNQKWSFDFASKSGKTGSYWHVWDESKSTLLKVEADSGKVSAPYGFVGNLTGKASTAGTADNATNLTAGAALGTGNKITTTNPTKIGAGNIKVHTVYQADGPASFGNLINIGGNGGFQMFVEWSGSQTAAGQNLIGRIFTRFWRDNQAAWTAWKELAYNTADVTFNAGTFNGKVTATAAGIRIPTSQPSSISNGDIWIE